MSWGAALRSAVGLGLGGIPSLLNAPPYAKLAFNFLSGVLDPRITFSRTTNATLIGSNGQLQYAPNNLLPYSEQLDDAAWTKVVVTASANVITAPDGTLTAEKLEEVAATNFHMVRQTITVANNTQYTMSAYFNLGERKFVELAPFIGGIGGVSAYFNLETGEITNVAGTNWKVDSTLLTFVGSGWCRCSITFTTGTGGSAFVDYRLAPSSGTNSYAGTLGSGAYMWGAQLNVGALQPYYSTSVKNQLGYSQEFDNAAWSKNAATITANIIAAPDGSLTADKLVEDTATTGHYTTPTVSPSVVVGQVLTYSVYAKAAERTFLQLILTGAGPAASNLTAGFDLTTGTAGTPSAGSTSSIVSVGNGWYRCGITTPIATAGIPTRQIRISQNSSSSPSSYAGDGTSGLYLWGAQSSDSASLDPYVYNPGAAPSNTAYYGPRFDYDPVTLAAKGLLIEEQRTNICLYSSDLTNATWVYGANAVITGNTVVAPDGATTADTIAVNGSDSGVYQNIACSSSTAYTFSLYVKLGTMAASDYKIAIYDNTNAAFIAADIVPTQTPSSTAWTRVTYTFTTPATCVSVRLYCVRNGLAAASSVNVWGMQLEAGAFATSVIPTTTTALTRAADALSIIGANFSNWYNPVEGTTYVEAATLPNVTAAALTHAISDGTFNQSIYGNFSGGNLYVGANALNGGINQASGIGSFSIAASTNITKDAFAYKQDNFGESCNGATPKVDLVGTIPTVNRLYIGSNWSGAGNYLNGHIRSFAYYPTRLRNSALQLLTR